MCEWLLYIILHIYVLWKINAEGKERRKNYLVQTKVALQDVNNAAYDLEYKDELKASVQLKEDSALKKRASV